MRAPRVWILVIVACAAAISGCTESGRSPGPLEVSVVSLAADETGVDAVLRFTNTGAATLGRIYAHASGLARAADGSFAAYVVNEDPPGVYDRLERIFNDTDEIPPGASRDVRLRYRLDPGADAPAGAAATAAVFALDVSVVYQDATRWWDVVHALPCLDAHGALVDPSCASVWAIHDEPLVGGLTRAPT